MLKKTVLAMATTALMLGASGAAFADECSGRDHSTGTVLGALGGSLLGGFASHGNGLGIIGGAILGGLAGNAISRSPVSVPVGYSRANVSTTSLACSRLRFQAAD